MISNFKQRPLHNALRLALVAGTSAVAGVGTAVAQETPEPGTTSQSASSLDRVTVTGSRIKRADIEGALPVIVIDRAQLEASGDVSVADYLRGTNFNSFGSFQSTSGNAAMGFSGISLRGLGTARTLILIDGRRAPTAPMVGNSQDLNSIPMAAIERIEILSDGASAVYGSDALGGVINIITRRDFEGAELTYGAGRPTLPGGDTEEMSFIIGSAGERSRVLAGASYSNRDVIFSRDRDYWYSETNRGQSTYSNNFSTLVRDGFGNLTRPSTLGAAGRLRHPLYGAAVPGLCTNDDDDDLFYMLGSTPANLTCHFNHTATSANLTQLENTAVFARGDVQINDDWMLYFSGTVSRLEGFGRFAAVPSSPWPGGAISLLPGSPNHPGTIGGNNPLAADPYYQQFANEEILLYHRFAALGERDNKVENTTYSYNLGFEGRVADRFDVDLGARYLESRATNLGTNYVVGPLAQAAITDGRYNIYDPYAGDPSALGLTATISRDMKTTVKEVYGSAAFDLFDMAGGTSAAVVGAEYREEFYQDIYDPLSASGQIVGSSGASASGGRDVYAAYGEILFPVFDKFEINLAGRYERYNDYGSDFAPKISFRWQPLDNLTLRATYGEGFRAPPLNLLTQAPAFAAAATTDPATCLMLTGAPGCQTQVTTYGISNAALFSEQSKQWGLGAVWDATDWLNVTLDYYNIEITDSIVPVNLALVVGCLRGSIGLCPAGLTQFPAGTSLPNAALGLGASFENNDVFGGILNAQTGSANIGFIETDGVDLSIRTNFDFDGMGRLRSLLSISHVNNFSSDGNPSVVGNPGNPRLRGMLSNIWEMGDWSVNWNVNYIHGTQSQAYRNWLALVRTPNRTPAQNANLDFNASFPTRLPSYVINDIQVNYKAPWNATITLGVNNVANKEPVYDRSTGGTSYNANLYDPWGRIPYVRYTQRF
jgi:iron complex outermembrane recepter protein